MPQPLIYRSVLGGVRQYAEWLVKLGKRSGAYVIRSKRTHEVLYVGESHSGRLAATIRRHFQGWNDRTGRSHYTVAPGAVEVAVRVTPPLAAAGCQNRLILRLQPKYNGVVPDEVPF